MMGLLFNLIDGVVFVLDSLLRMYWYVVIIAVIASWVNADPYNPIVRFLRGTTEPALARIRRWLPFVYTSGIDFSPIVLLLGISFVQIVLIGSLRDLRGQLVMGSGVF